MGTYKGEGILHFAPKGSANMQTVIFRIRFPAAPLPDSSDMHEMKASSLQMLLCYRNDLISCSTNG